MKIQVEIPIDKLDAAVKNLKRTLDGANRKIRQLMMERDRAIEEVKLTRQMYQDFKSLCNQYADLQ